jgi:flagellin-specific chaperone FliS
MKHDGVDAYKQSQVTGASPGQLVLMLYDHVIKCLKDSDQRGACKGIVELMGALDVDYQEISGRLFSLYEFCLDQVKKGNTEEACRMLSEMRDMWATALNNMTADKSTGKQEGEPAKETTDVIV